MYIYIYSYFELYIYIYIYRYTTWLLKRCKTKYSGLFVKSNIIVDYLIISHTWLAFKTPSRQLFQLK